MLSPLRVQHLQQHLTLHLSHDFGIDALLAVIESVRRDEPGTLNYYVNQSPDDPNLFVTFERFHDQAAMDRHNNSPAVAKFVDVAGPVLADKVVIHTCNELAAK